jgi:hypothetical protein
VRLGVTLGLVVAATAVRANPVDPTHLAPLAVGTGKGEPTAVYVTGVDPDVVLFALATSDFAVIAGGTPIDGKLGDHETVMATAAFDAVAPPATLRLARAHSGRPVDLAFRGVDPLEVLRFLADTAGASYVFAPQHVLPAITVRANHVEPLATARELAKLAGLELVVHGHAWIVVEPLVHLDPKLLARTKARTRIEIDHAHPGEARRLLDPDVAQDKNACPKDTWIDASLHGEIGALEAVLATMQGPACEQEPNLDELDTANAHLLGIAVGPKLRRAVFRVPHGARAFEPTGRGQRVEVDYVIVRSDETAALRSGPVTGSAYVAPGPFEATDRDAWQLRGTVRVGTTWRAIFRGRSEWRILDTAEITAGSARSSVDGRPRSYTLER